MNPYDLTQCLDTASGMWRDAFLRSDIGVNEEALEILRKSVYAGLVNMGATCYVNSFVQSVYFNTDFMDLVMSCGATPGSALHAFQSLLADLKYSVLSKVSPLEFLDKFSIKLNLQEDAAEFSTLLLNWLDQQVGGNRVRALFEGETEHTTMCSHCGHVSVNSERFMEIQVNADAGALRSASFVHDEVVEGYRCGNTSCSPASPSGVRRSAPRRLPKHLRVVVNRYRYNFDTGREKISAPLTVPLTTLAVPSLDGRVSRYICKGILEHHSDRASSGHYTASLRDASTWWLFDDASVEPISIETKRKGPKSVWSESTCVSTSAYVALFEREDADTCNSSLIEQPYLRLEAEARNAHVLADLAQKKALRDRLSSAVAERKIEVVSLTQFDSRVVEGRCFAITASALQAFTSGQDLSRLFFPSVVTEGFNILCSHGQVSPLSVRNGLAKFVPNNLTGSLIETEVCSACNSELSHQVEMGVEFFSKSRQLIDAKYNFLLKGFEKMDFSNRAVWVHKPSIPRFRKELAVSGTLLDKVCQSGMDSGRPDRVEVDLTANVVCVHGRLLSEAHTDSDMVLKPLELVEHLERLSMDMRDDLYSFAPKVVAKVILNENTVPGCTECESARDSKNSALVSVKSRLSGFFEKDPISDVASLIPGEQYFAFPGAWVQKLKQWVVGGAKSAPRDIRMDLLVCPHGDLKIDIVSALQEKRKDKLSFVIFPEAEGRFVLSDEFKSALGLTGKSSIAPVLIEKDRTYTVGSCPIVCPVCLDTESLSKQRGVSIRVFHEKLDTLDSLSKPVKVNVNDTVVLYKPGRSRLVGAAPGIESNTTGIDIKLALIDIGILDQSPFPISPDDAIGRLNVYVAHPSMRGSLVLVKDDVPIIETISSLGAAGRSTLNTFDTVYVEFTKSSADSSPKRRRKGPIATDKDAGMQGSILRI